jgi:hypothetical protein
MAGSLAGPYQHSHLAKIEVPSAYNVVCGWQELEPGVRVDWRRNPTTLAQKPAAAEFDAGRFSPQEAIAWLNAQNIADQYEFQEDSDTTDAGEQTSRATGSRCDSVLRSRATVAALNGGCELLPRTSDWDDDQEERLQGVLQTAGLVPIPNDDFPPSAAEYCRKLDKAAADLAQAMGWPPVSGTV